MRTKRFIPNPDHINKNYSPLLENVMVKKLKGVAPEDVELTKRDMLKLIKSSGANIIGEPMTLLKGGDYDRGSLDAEIVIRLDRQLDVKNFPMFKNKYSIDGCIMSKYANLTSNHDKAYKELVANIVMAHFPDADEEEDIK